MSVRCKDLLLHWLTGQRCSSVGTSVQNTLGRFSITDCTFPGHCQLFWTWRSWIFHIPALQLHFQTSPQALQIPNKYCPLQHYIWKSALSTFKGARLRASQLQKIQKERSRIKHFCPSQASVSSVFPALLIILAKSDLGGCPSSLASLSVCPHQQMVLPSKDGSDTMMLFFLLLALGSSMKFWILTALYFKGSKFLH